MLPSSEVRLQRSAQSGRVVVCVLLAVLFLYNPFFTIFSTSGALDVQHLASFRAGIAASELRRCVNAGDKLEIPALGAAALSAVVPPRGLDEVFPYFHGQPMFSAPRIARSNLWFRPPPIS